MVVAQVVQKRHRVASKRRTQEVCDSKKQTIAAARKKYTAMKKTILKALRAGKKRSYNSQKEMIRTLSPKQRKAARVKVRAELKQRLDRLLKDIKPASFYKRVDGLLQSVPFYTIIYYTLLRLGVHYYLNFLDERVRTYITMSCSRRLP